MEFAKLILRDEHYYLSEKNSEQLSLLSMFLTDDSGSADGSWIRWILDDNLQDTVSNYTFVEKEGDMLIMGCQFDDNPYDRALELKKTQLIYILEHWYKLRKRRANEIIITRENDTFNIEGKGFPQSR